MVADWSNKDNWILADFLFEIGQSSIPSYPIILGSNNGEIRFLPNQLSPPIPPNVAKNNFISSLEEIINTK
tara:strand:+ start:170 stop:382 length:213 start_codon:yes stop_codon:yes gene_type:complete